MSTYQKIFFAVTVLVFWGNQLVNAATEKTEVIYVGGIGATDENLKSWVDAASKNSKFNHDFKFSARALHSTDHDQNEVLKIDKKLVEELVRKIDSSPKDAHFILAGHSSGSAVTNEVARRIKDKSKLKLVVLDGFIPVGLSSEVFARCWSAESANSELKASNYDGMNSCTQTGNIKAYGCTNSMCLHFILINSAAAVVGVDESNFVTKGYAELKPNLSWLNEFKGRKFGAASISNQSR